MVIKENNARAQRLRESKAKRIREQAKKILGKDYIEDLPLPLTEALILEQIDKEKLK